MIRLRVDVDYSHSSRIRSFISTILDVRLGRDYLKNAKIIANMINTSSKEIETVWFFTIKTIPDSELLSMLNNSKHKIGLHIVNDPQEEMELLEQRIRRRMHYYTIHGTARLLGRVIWKRWKAGKPEIPKNFRLESYHKFITSSLDIICYNNSQAQAYKIAKTYVNQGHVLHFHPIWLFQRGKFNHRGPFYDVLRRILTDGT